MSVKHHLNCYFNRVTFRFHIEELDGTKSFSASCVRLIVWTKCQLNINYKKKKLTATLAPSIVFDAMNIHEFSPGWMSSAAVYIRQRQSCFPFSLVFFCFAQFTFAPTQEHTVVNYDDVDEVIVAHAAVYIALKLWTRPWSAWGKFLPWLLYHAFFTND